MNSESFGWSARRILVVDDEAPVRELLVRVLQNAGYLVVAARSGPEALRLAEQEPTLDLLITDFAMRGMNGIEVANALRETRPHMKVLVTSTYHPEQFEKGELPAWAEYLEKPWTPSEMIDRVATILARG